MQKPLNFEEDKLVYTVFHIKGVWKQNYHMKKHTYYAIFSQPTLGVSF